MRKVIYFFVFTFNPNAQSVLHLEGSFNGENIYVQNPQAKDGIDFCTDSIIVNGKKMEIDHRSFAYELRLRIYS